MKLKCIAVDDEPLALGLLVSYIERTPFLNLAGKYTSPLEALNAIYKQDLQLIFLDIQMVGLDGIELARVLNQSKHTATPRVIFTTAYNHFALEGYRVDALDYLLKPFNYEEFIRAATKGWDYFKLIHKNAGHLLNTNDQYLYLRVDYELVKVALRDILYVEGFKDYVKVHLLPPATPVLSLITLKSLEEKLPLNGFMRLHRSFIVALDKIDSISRNAVRIGKIKITVGEQYRELFKDFVDRWT